MPRPKKTPAKPTAAKVHLKMLGTTTGTQEQYKTAVKRFFMYVQHVLERPPADPHELRFAAAEFVNFLYQDDRPLYWAADFLSGFKRYYASSKYALDEAQLYYRNWATSIVRQKACPFPLEFIQVMIAVAVSEGSFELATLCLLAYVGLFRLGELFGLRLGQIDVVNDQFCLITLYSSKTTGPVAISIRDVTIINVLKKRLAVGRPEHLLYAGSYRTVSLFLRKIAFLLGVPGDRFTGHGFRRGGATHLFRLTSSYDQVQSVGRWACAKTCRSYVDEALSDRQLLSVTGEFKVFMQQAVAGYPDFMRRLM